MNFPDLITEKTELDPDRIEPDESVIEHLLEVLMRDPYALLGTELDTVDDSIHYTAMPGDGLPAGKERE